MTFEVREGDCVELMAAMPAGSVDAVVCDPPYGLEFMGKEWDSFKPNARSGARADGGPSFGSSIRYQEQGIRAQHAAQEWHQAWATEALRVLKPGGHLLAFGGTRTYHRLVCAVEDAGFEIRDTISWLYGSGFPKSLDVSKALDGRIGKQSQGFSNAGDDGRDAELKQDKSFRSDYGYQYEPATPEAERWEGWGTALKPAWESIVVGRKPVGEADIIRENLCVLQAKLLSLSSAQDADESSLSRPAVQDALDHLATAGWTVDELTSTRAALCEAMGTSQFETGLTISLNTVSSWLGTLAALCELTSTFITETASATTTALQTLKSSLSDLTPRTIIEDASRTGGLSFSALPAVRAFNGVESRLSATRELLAPAPVTDASQESSPLEGVKPDMETVVVARKPQPSATPLKFAHRNALHRYQHRRHQSLPSSSVNATARWWHSSHVGPMRVTGVAHTFSRHNGSCASCLGHRIVGFTCRFWWAFHSWTANTFRHSGQKYPGVRTTPSWPSAPTATSGSRTGEPSGIGHGPSRRHPWSGRLTVLRRLATSVVLVGTALLGAHRLVAAQVFGAAPVAIPTRSLITPVPTV